MSDLGDMAKDPKHRRTFEKLLILAAKRGDAEQVAERLSWGIDPNCTTPKGRTPLIANIRSGSPNSGVAKALLQAGADASLTDQAGLTALDYARRKLARLQAKPRKRRKSPNLDENNQLRLPAWEQKELDRMRREGCDPDFLKMYWQERLKAARRVFNDPVEVERIVELLEGKG
jgi:hypothetical protein